MLGYVVDYDPGMNDNSLLEVAEREGAVLLTRDKELHNRAEARDVRALLVTGNSEEEKLASVSREFGISLVIDLSLTRCPKCGSSLSAAEKTELANRVPVTSLELYTDFWKCTNPSCSKVYWRGSHWKNIDLMLANARKLLEVH